MTRDNHESTIAGGPWCHHFPMWDGFTSIQRACNSESPQLRRQRWRASWEDWTATAGQARSGSKPGSSFSAVRANRPVDEDLEVSSPETHGVVPVALVMPWIRLGIAIRSPPTIAPIGVAAIAPIAIAIAPMRVHVAAASVADLLIFVTLVVPLLRALLVVSDRRSTRSTISPLPCYANIVSPAPPQPGQGTTLRCDGLVLGSAFLSAWSSSFMRRTLSRSEKLWSGVEAPIFWPT